MFEEFDNSYLFVRSIAPSAVRLWGGGSSLLDHQFLNVIVSNPTPMKKGSSLGALVQETFWPVCSSSQILEYCLRPIHMRQIPPNTCTATML